MRTRKAQWQRSVPAFYPMRALAAAFLCCLLFSLFYCQEAHAATVAAPAAGKYPSACTKQDFNSFFEGFMELPAKQQALCVRYPFKDPVNPKKKYTTPKAWLASKFGKYPIISSPASLRKKGLKTSTPFFSTVNNYSQGMGQYGYIVGGQGQHTRKAVLVEGTYEFETVFFEWTGSVWLVTGMTSPDEGI